jgi:hypothetical protein
MEPIAINGLNALLHQCNAITKNVFLFHVQTINLSVQLDSPALIKNVFQQPLRQIMVVIVINGQHVLLINNVSRKSVSH